MTFDDFSEVQMFKGRQFDQSVILLCVRWYLAYNLNLRDLEEIMAERGCAALHRVRIPQAHRVRIASRGAVHIAPLPRQCAGDACRHMAGNRAAIE